MLLLSLKLSHLGVALLAHLSNHSRVCLEYMLSALLRLPVCDSEVFCILAQLNKSMKTSEILGNIVKSVIVLESHDSTRFQVSSYLKYLLDISPVPVDARFRLLIVLPLYFEQVVVSVIKLHPFYLCLRYFP